jgi:hypothetical protein
MSSNSRLQLAPAPIAPIPSGSINQAGILQAQASLDKQMSLISGGNKRYSTRKRGHKRRKSTKKQRQGRKRRQRTGGAIIPQTFPPTYPQPAGGITPNDSSVAITKLFASSAANSEYDGLVGTKPNTSTSGGKRRIKSCLKSRRKRRKRKRRGGTSHVKWGCMS